MKMVIDVSEDTFKRHKWRVNHDACTELDIALAKGTPLTEELYKIREELRGNYRVLLKNIPKDDWASIIPYLMHNDMGIPISECKKAYDVAIDYLRSKGKAKG